MEHMQDEGMRKARKEKDGQWEQDGQEKNGRQFAQLAVQEGGERPAGHTTQMQTKGGQEAKNGR